MRASSLLLLAACCLAVAHDEGAAGCAFVVATPAAPGPLRRQARSARLLLATRRRPTLASGARGDGGARKGAREFVKSPATGAALPLHVCCAWQTHAHGATTWGTHPRGNGGLSIWQRDLSIWNSKKSRSAPASLLCVLGRPADPRGRVRVPQACRTGRGLCAAREQARAGSKQHVRAAAAAAGGARGRRDRCGPGASGWVGARWRGRAACTGMAIVARR
jgi:hypothetical protein